MHSGLRLETRFHGLGEALPILRKLSFRVHVWVSVLLGARQPC